MTSFPDVLRNIEPGDYTADALLATAKIPPDRVDYIKHYLNDGRRRYWFPDVNEVFDVEDGDFFVIDWKRQEKET